MSESSLPHKTRLHGFHSFVDFLKALGWLGALVGGVLWTFLTMALDDKYSRVEDVGLVIAQIEQTKEQVREAQRTANAVDSKLEVLSDVVIGEAVFSKKIDYCTADNAALKNELNRQLGALIQKYRDLTGEQPYIPDCE